MARLLLVLFLAGCATAPAVPPAPSDDALARQAEQAWRQRVADGAVTEVAEELPTDPLAAELLRRRAAAGCQLAVDVGTGVVRLGETPLFFPSAALSEALASTPEAGLIHTMPTRALDGLLVGLDVDDARETLWFVSCQAPHKPERYLTVAGADFTRAAIHPSGTSLVFAREALYELPLQTGVPARLLLTPSECERPQWSPRLWTIDGIVADVTGECPESRVVLAPSAAGWRATPYVEVMALAWDDRPALARGQAAGPMLYLGLRDAAGVLVRSRDLGDTWEAVTLDPATATTSAEDVLVTPRFIAVRTALLGGLGGEVLVSSNRKTFARARRPFGDAPVERLWLTEAGNLLAGREESGAWQVLESNDLGRTWHAAHGTPPARPEAMALPGGGRLEPGERGLWKRRPHGSRALVYPAGS